MCTLGSKLLLSLDFILAVVNIHMTMLLPMPTKAILNAPLMRRRALLTRKVTVGSCERLDNEVLTFPRVVVLLNRILLAMLCYSAFS